MSGRPQKRNDNCISKTGETSDIRHELQLRCWHKESLELVCACVNGIGACAADRFMVRKFAVRGRVDQWVILKEKLGPFEMETFFPHPPQTSICFLLNLIASLNRII